MFNRLAACCISTVLFTVATCGVAQTPAQKITTTTTTEPAAAKPPAPPPSPAPDATSDGSVTLGGQKITYTAVAGTITVGSTDAQDATLTADGKQTSDSAIELPAKPQERPATAQMFYVAYFRKGVDTATRPVTFLYNGGPGSPTMYLHLGAFGPRKVVLQDLAHPAGGPFRIVDNPASLLDVSDLVFIDAPGTGYSRVHGQDGGKAFYGVDEDAFAFRRFVNKWLSKHNRWTSPRFLFGESYGTTRSAVLSNALSGTGLNGVILLSQILNFNLSADGATSNPGTDDPFYLSLPSYAATAWFHKRVPNAPADLQAFLRDVEHFALTDYAAALHQGADLPQATKESIATKLFSYTGIPAATWLKANLRLDGQQFAGLLQTDAGITTGRLDSRYSGPALNPMETTSDYDPFMDATGAAFLAAMNQYAHTELKYGQELAYKPSAYGPDFHWDMHHRSPMGGGGWEGSLNVMPDLATAMLQSPNMHVLLMGGYYDLGTLYFAATYEMHHLPMPQALQSNISYHWFQTGHMVYVNDAAAMELHAQTAAFIQANSR